MADRSSWFPRVPRWAALILVALGIVLMLGLDAVAAVLSHWFLFVLYTTVILGMGGLVGRGLGLQNIFHEDPELAGRYGAEHGAAIYRHSPAFHAQAAITASLVYFWGFAFTLDLFEPGGMTVTMSELAPQLGPAVALGSLVSLFCGVVPVTSAVGPLQPGEWKRCIAGAAAGLVYAWIVFWIAIRLEAAMPPDWAAAPTYALMVPGLVSTILVLRYRRLLAAVSLVSLLTLIAILYAFLATFVEVWQPVAVLGVLALMLFANGLGARLLGLDAPLKFQIPGIVDAERRNHYDRGRLLDLARIYQPEDGKADEAGGVAEKLDRMVEFRRDMAEQTSANQTAQTATAASRTTKANRLDPIDTLEAWRARVPQRELDPPAGFDPAAVPHSDPDLIGRALAEIRAMPEHEPAGGKIPMLPGPGQRQPPAAPPMPDRRPKLVLIATSGGAYRASFWTGIVLDTLSGLDRAGVLPGFCHNVRLITGASGGMVGGAYFSAMADPAGGPTPSICAAIEEDVLAVQTEGTQAADDYPYTTRFPIPRDSLSPVAQQLVQRDLPGLFLPGVQKVDRGTVLEDQWERLDIPFAALAPGEAEGWRPSLIVSPMLVETGQPLLISNLDMDLVRRDKLGETVQFFDWFPASHDSFKVKTAVRLNAAFPYVAPAAALPTSPYRRVVDAGYYDNYGVDLAATYLARPEIREWVLAHTSGVVVLQLRAFPFAPPSVEQPNALKRGLQWLTTPIEGMLAARGSTMTFRNRQSLRQVRNSYAADTGHTDFVATVSFEVDSDTSMNWYLPGRELDAMRAGMAHELNQAALSELLRVWWR